MGYERIQKPEGLLYHYTRKENLESIKQLLDTGGNTRYKIVELPGLNHMFQRCKECTREEIPDLEDVFSEEALQIMGDWLRENIEFR